MKWNEIFRTRKLLKRLISMSLCIGMAGGQLLSGIPIQAEEQTDESTDALPTDTKINPNITIQHYYNFPAMVLGNVEDEYNTLKANGNGNDNPYYSEENKEDLKKYLAGEDPYKEKFLTVWNTALRNGELPSNTDLSASYKTLREKDPKSTIQLENSDLGTIKTKKILYKMFADETVHYLEKPQMRYMNKLYNGTSADHYNANYTLSEVWLKKVNTDNEKEKNSIDPDSFVHIKAPRLATDSSRHDPSKFIFTNNDQNANIQGGTTEKDIRYHIKGNAENPEQVTVLVTDGMVIRLVFEATEGDLKYEDVDFFDYDITDGKVYASQNDAWTRSHDIDEDKEKGAQRELDSTSTYYVNTQKQGINLNSDPFAFGNSDGAAGTTMGDKLWKNSETLNRSNANNRFRPNQWGISYNGTNLQGATFGLVSGVNSDGSLSWSEGVGAPSLFSTTELKGKTVYEGLAASDPNNKTQENYSLQFNRMGGTYTLSGVNRDDLENSAVLKGLDTLPPIKHAHTDGKNVTIHSNEFWPMDYASSYGTVGHDIQFGDSILANQRKYVSSSNNSANLPESDGGKDHNAYFGMTTTIPFTLEKGYCAPLRYFFYGDDDMFVFLNKLDENGNVIDSKQIADLGGVHSSVGTLVDLWDFIDTGDKNPIEKRLDVNGKEETVYEYTGPVHEKKDGTTPANYQLAIYYLERGASGSSCYMRFSVPFEGLSMEETAMNGQIQVEKEVRYSLQNEEPSPENQDQYVYQLTLQNPEGEDLNNQYEILIYNLDENGNRKEGEVSRGYIAPNGTFRITNKQQALITGLPRSGPDDNLSTSKYKGYYYEVKELGTYDKTYTNSDYSESDDTNLKNLRPISPNTSTTFLSGTIEKGLDLEQGKYQEGYAFSSLIKDQNYVRFINAEDPGVIKLKKVVDPQIETDTDFTFNITLTNAETSIKTLPYILNRANPSQGQSDQELGTKTSDEGKEGQFEFKLKKDDELILYNLPVGTKYEIKEAQAKTASEQFEVKEIQFSGKYVPDGETNSKSVVRGIIQASTDNTKPEIGVTFVNEYHKIAEVNIPVHKTVTGKPFTGVESYTFEITPVTEGAPMPEKTQINVAPGNGMATIAAENVYDANGQFGPIVFDDTMNPGKYIYTIREIAGEDTNIQYDSHIYNVVVTATKDVSGNVSARITSIDSSSVSDESSVNLEFTNDKVSPIDLSIPVEKNLVGRNVETTDSFTFRISEDETHDNPKRLSNLISDRSLTIEPGTNHELKGEFILSKFTLEDVGKEYWFVLEEQKGNIEQLDYDTSKITVKVTFELKDTDDGSKTIVPVIQRVEGENPAIDAENPVVFTNTYRPTGTLKIPVTKTLEGRSFTNGDRFLFEITGEEGAPLPAQTILSVLPTTGPSVESLFGPITYTEENVGETYLYTVKEISTGLSGIKYDEAKYEVKVNVTKNDEGKIIPNAIYNNGTTDVNEIEFVNHYDPEVVVKLPVMKTLEGRPMTDSDKFVFDLNGEGSAPMPEHNQVTVQGKGDHTAETTFDPIVFKNEGTYKYRITEHQGSIEHIQYSKVEYTVTVNIAKDTVSGALTSSYSMVSSAAPAVTSDTAAFVNIYQPSGTWRPSVTKELLGAELKDQAYSFEMTVKDNAGAVIYQKEARNSADGSVDFPLVQFNTVGYYTAVIKEEALPAGSSVQYDTHTIEYTLKVEDHDGELVVTQNPPKPFVFTNDAGLRISKQLIPGSGQTLDENDLNYDFPFEVQFSDNMASKTLHAKRNGKEETLTVSADAKVNFKLKHDDTLIIYDIPKNTAYSVSENSSSKWIDKYLQIDTIGDSNGTFSNGVEASVTFRNLKPRTDDVVISGFKTMDPNGDPYPMQAGLYSFKISADGQSTSSRNLNKESEFVPEEEPLDDSFEIHRSSLPELDINDDEEDPGDSQTEEPEIPAPADSQQKRKLTMIRREAETKAAPEDTPLPDDPIAKNNEFGRFEFGKIVFTTPGIYTYRIEELPSTIPGMKHDTRTYKAEITVVEKNGSVEVQRIRYMDMNNNVLDNPIVFVNTYSETQKPKLEIHKEQSRNFEPFTREKQTVNAGDLVTYRLTVTNTGDALAKNVMIHDTVPVPEGDGDAQLTLLKSSLINNVALDGNKITWSIGDLAPGTSYSVSFQVQVPKVKSATSWKNIATTTTDSPLDEKPDPSEEVTIESEPAKPDVTIHKYESTTQSERYDKTKPLEVKSGELVTYDMIVTNSGNEDATNVVVTDKVPDGLEFVQAFDGGSYENRMITWNVGTLAANGGTAIVSFQIRVPVVEKDEEWSNIASLKYDGEKPKNSNEVKINTIVKNLEIEKLQAINHGPLTKDLQAVKAGDVVTYALHITNPGDHTIENATAKDTVPDGLELITDSISDGGTYNSQTHEIIWNLGKVDAKDEKQVTFSVKVPKVDQKTSWKNIATLIYDNEKPKDSNEVVVGTDLPNLTIVKDQKLETDPDYTFEKRTGQTGDTLTYRLTVTNTGTATAKDVVIEDTIPTAELMETPLFLRFVSASDNGELNDRTQTITWSIGDVAPGQSRSVTFTVTIPGVKQNTLWINKAYTHYENNPDNPDEGEPKDIPSNEVKVDTMVPAVILEKEHKLNDGDRVTSLLHGNAHDTVTYYLKAANTSMATAHDVWIKDTIPTHENGTLVLKEIDETYAHELNKETGEIVWKIGDLAPGEEKEVWFSVTVPEVQEATRWRNIASVSHQEDPTVPREEIETPPVEVEVLVPELEIVKRQAKNDGSLTQGLIQANAGDTITYAIEVSNTGTGPAQNIVVEDIIPEGLELVNGSISDQGQNRGGKITWNMASLEAGKAKTFTFKVKVPSVKEYTRWANVATVSDEDDPDPKPTPPVEVETEAPHLTVEKLQKRNEGNRTKDKLSVVGKDRVTYFIKVTNDGQADAKDVVVSDVVPEGLILVDGSVSDSGLVEKGVISWQLGTLAAGASRTVSFVVDVPESEGVWKNIAEAIESTHPKEPTPSNEVEIETPKEEPNITIEKLQAQNDAQPSKTRIKARVDDTITYVLRVQNRGKETVRDIVVKDAIPQGLRFVSGSISKEGTIENGVVSWKIEELAPDQLVDLTFQVKVPVVTRNSAWINVGVLIHDDKQTPSNEVTVSIEPETPASSKNGKPTSPNTAAETNHMIWLGALMISVLVLAVLWKRKKNISH